MTLMKQWDDLAQAVANDRGAAQRFWSDYYQKEKAVYEILLDEPDKVYEGTVVTIKDFGAFVNIMPGIDGMLHISQIVEGRRLKSVDEVLKVGQKVRVRLVAIDNGKLSLSMIGVEK